MIDYKGSSAWGEEARALTSGRGVDQIVEVGGPGTLLHALINHARKSTLRAGIADPER